MLGSPESPGCLAAQSGSSNACTETVLHCTIFTHVQACGAVLSHLAAKGKRAGAVAVARADANDLLCVCLFSTCVCRNAGQR